MRREEGRKGEERSELEEEEAVGVFVCPRRPLSSHYQRIRQMLPLYRCWFDSEPPTLIPSSLLSSSTPPLHLPRYIVPSTSSSIVCQKYSQKLSRSNSSTPSPTCSFFPSPVVNIHSSSKLKKTQILLELLGLQPE